LSFLRKIAGAFVVLEPPKEAPESEDSQSEMSPEEIARVLSLVNTPLKSSPKVSQAPGAVAPTVEVTTFTQQATQGTRPFSEIYAEAGVPATPKTAEQLLKLLEGLKELGPAVMKTTLAALDRAEDHWAAEDAVLDAGHKVRALSTEKARLAEGLMGKRAEVAAKKLALSSELEASTRTIRDQIAEMEALLRDEEASSAKAQAFLDAEVSSEEAAVTQAARGLDSEIARLNTLPALVGAPTGE
jgi:hypothetical protein